MPTQPKALHFLAISGSLRAASLNSLLLRAIANIAPAGTDVVLYQGLGQLPPFNPDIEDPLPGPVAHLKNQIIAADAVIIASPEYAHGVTGVLKNALDWMVGNESFVNKPVALLNTSARAVHAYAALREIIGMMSAHIIDEASLTIPLFGSGLTEGQLAGNPQTLLDLNTVLAALRKAIESPSSPL
ncbi:NADPH-dependent FMN reductase [Methylovulum miyakonense]|uniref:NADPH-dependent FMN reductase n=1 Tax=Methylovulum miyakonense TaxID=645578 RepID=UPI000371632F|nr:NADPH-dependent FMN reductase [Methylovulum miyakonense]